MKNYASQLLRIGIKLLIIYIIGLIIIGALPFVNFPIIGAILSIIGKVSTLFILIGLIGLYGKKIKNYVLKK